MKQQHMDLNLFRVFDAVMTHRTVAGASRELGITASAVSHALARLRRLLGDELFLPSADGMRPTARATELGPSIRDGLGTITEAVDARPFNPAETIRTFAIAASDFATFLVLPGLLKRLSACAPHASVRVMPPGRLDVVQQLDEGRIDLVLGWFGPLPARVERQALLEDQEAMIVRAGHPLTQQAVTRQKLFAYPHVVVELTGSEDHANHGFIDDRGVIRRVWIERLLVETSSKGRRLIGRVAATVSTYGVVGSVVASTDMIATLPRRLAERTVQKEGVVMLDLPYPPLVATLEMVWHERAKTDSGLRWLIQQVAAAGAEVDRGAIKQSDGLRRAGLP